MPGSIERMLKLVDEVFAVRTDPEQIDVDEDVLEKLRMLHPATVSEYNDDGPAAWLLIFPTTLENMKKFLSNEITEKQLLEKTFPGETFDAIYLCSVVVLEEYRRKGIAGKMALDAIEKIKGNHPIRYLYAWIFTEEGRTWAEDIARKSGLPLKEKIDLKK
jgi:hypothetical protein